MCFSMHVIHTSILIAIFRKLNCNVDHSYLKSRLFVITYFLMSSTIKIIILITTCKLCYLHEYKLSDRGFVSCYLLIMPLFFGTFLFPFRVFADWQVAKKPSASRKNCAHLVSVKLCLLNINVIDGSCVKDHYVVYVY